jgi:hypothetical protein
MYKIGKGMTQVDRSLIKELSGYIRAHTPHGKTEGDYEYKPRPEALEIAQLGFDAAARKIDAAVRLPLLKLVSEDVKSSYGAGDVLSGMVIDISVEYSNLAIRISKILDTLEGS